MRIVLLFTVFLMAACTQGGRRANDQIVFHMPASHQGRSCHLYVRLSSDLNYEVTKRFRSYHVDDPTKGVLKHFGTASPRDVDQFIDGLRAIQAETIDDATVRNRMHNEENRFFIADGLEFDYTVDWGGYKASFNELSQYMDTYPQYPEFVIGQRAMKIFMKFGNLLYNHAKQGGQRDAASQRPLP